MPAVDIAAAQAITIMLSRFFIFPPSGYDDIISYRATAGHAGCFARKKSATAYCMNVAARLIFSPATAELLSRVSARLAA
jgi:hypothetical protein